MIKTKNKAILQQISDTAWILKQGPRKMGILNKDVQDKYFYINGKTIEYFTDEIEVAEKFGNAKIFEEQITTSPVVTDTFYIKGHPIDYETPFPIDTSHVDYNEEVPLYTKTSESDIYYAAGWYAINFEKGWKHGHGPKYSTLTKYGYKGPFKTEIECRQV
jgi:hypothetical protein